MSEFPQFCTNITILNSIQLGEVGEVDGGFFEADRDPVSLPEFLDSFDYFLGFDEVGEHTGVEGGPVAFGLLLRLVHGFPDYFVDLVVLLGVLGEQGVHLMVPLLLSFQ